MFGWLARGFLFIGGMIAGIFVSNDNMTHQILGMAIAILLFTTLAAIIAFWPKIYTFILKRLSKPQH